MLNPNMDRLITDWLQNNKEKILSQWMELIRVPSIRSAEKPGAPFGDECARALKTSMDLFKKEGFSVSLDEEGRYALADFGDGDTTIGLFSHSDVVPAGDGWKYTNPFEPKIVDGFMIGRGAEDNKAGTIAALCAMSIIRDHHLPVKSRLCSFIGSNEESGMADIKAFVKNEPMPALSLVPDAEYPCCIGEKSILRLTVTDNGKLEDILDFSGGLAMNVILEKVQVILKKTPEIFRELREKTAGKSYFSLTEQESTILLEAYGLSKHAAHPEGSVNAAVYASEVLSECISLSSYDRERMTKLHGYLATYNGEGLDLIYEDEDFGKLTAANGIVKTENGVLSFSLDIRFGAGLNNIEAEKRLTDFFEKDNWHISFVDNRVGFSIPKDSPFPEVITSLYKEIAGVESAEPYRMAGGTYSRFLKNAFSMGTSAPIPGKVIKKPEMPEGHGSIHQRDEAVSIEEMLQSIRILTHTIVECDRFLHQDA